MAMQRCLAVLSVISVAACARGSEPDADGPAPSPSTTIAEACHPAAATLVAHGPSRPLSIVDYSEGIAWADSDGSIFRNDKHGLVRIHGSTKRPLVTGAHDLYWSDSVTRTLRFLKAGASAPETTDVPVGDAFALDTDGELVYFMRDGGSVVSASLRGGEPAKFVGRSMDVKSVSFMRVDAHSIYVGRPTRHSL